MLTLPQNNVDLGHKRFLVVDDFDGMRNILRDLVRRCGAHQIDTSANGQDALNQLSRNKYDIILCDYNLGRGKNGQQVLEEARVQGYIGPSTIWCMITAEKTSEMVIGAAEHQPDDYLIKPLTEAMLLTRLDKLVRRKAAFASIQAAIQAKDYAKAVALCDKQLAEDRASAADINRLRCELLVQTGNYDAARAAYEKQLSVRETPWAKAGLAKLLYREGKYEEAREILEQLVESNRTYLEGYDWLAKTLNQLKKWQEAQKVLERAAALSPNSMARQHALGETALLCADLDVAEQAFRKSLNLGSNSALKTPDPYLGLAKVHTQKGNQQDALEVLGKLTKDIDGDAVLVQAKAAQVRVYQGTGDAAQALRCAGELAARVNSGDQDIPPTVALDLAEALMELGNKDAGSRMLEFVARNNHEDQALLERAQDIYEQADMGDAGQEALAACRRQATEAMDKGVTLARQGKLEEGVAVLREALDLMPTNTRILLNQAYLLVTFMEKQGWQAGLHQEARKCIETARRHAADEKRCSQLLAKLETLKA